MYEVTLGFCASALNKAEIKLNSCLMNHTCLLSLEMMF